MMTNGGARQFSVIVAVQGSTNMRKRPARPSVLAEGSFGAFVVDQLSELDGIEARPMFGGVGLYLDECFFGILYKQHLYFRVSANSIGDYKKRKMKPFKPFEGKKGSSKNYYEVPLEILESPPDLVAWAKKAAKAAGEKAD